EIPRKNSKSTMGAIVGLKMGFADNEPAAQVFSAANSEDQANMVFTPAWMMMKSLPDLESAFSVKRGGTEENPGPIYSYDTKSRFSRKIGKPKDGDSPHCWLQDEFHESPTSIAYMAGKTGQGARSQPILGTITTGGVNLHYPCYSLRKQVIDILSGHVENERLFGMIYTIDPEDDWQDFKNWIKANPNYGVSVYKDYLKDQHKMALQNAREQNVLKTKHLNLWCNAGSPWINEVDWDNCSEPSINIKEFTDNACYPGLDLASKIDIASKMRMFKKGDIYYLFSKHWTTTDKVKDKDYKHYKEWVDGGFLTAHVGARIDLSDIEETIRQDARDFDLSGSENKGGEVCADPWNAQQLTTNLLNDKIEVVEIAQNAKTLSEPMKELEAIIKEGKLRHDGNPVTKWMFLNVISEPDHNQNEFPRKESKNSPGKIDGAVATINAMARAMYDPGITQCQGNDGSLI
ncbi:MAG: terminase large subunit, partial [PVC group bacterium]|nr:terminase large subunit [PVC group bacterium]